MVSRTRRAGLRRGSLPARGAPLGAALALVALLGAGRTEAQPARRVLCRVIAVVDEQAITSTELERHVQLALSSAPIAERDPAARAAKLDALRRAALDQLIDALLLLGEAHRRGITATPEDVERALDGVAAQNGFDRASLLSAVRAQGLDERRYRRELAQQIAESRLLFDELDRGDASWRKLGDEERSQRMGRTRARLVGELRAARHVELRP